jgi:glycosyltransferase involved in cell wall biosynthesis
MNQQTRPLKILVLSAKGWGTGSALRAFYMAHALKKRGHLVVFPTPLPTWPLWLDMALATFTYLPAAFSRRFDAVWCVKPYPTLVPACLLQKLLGAKIIFDVDDLDWAYSSGAFASFHRALQTPWPKLLGTFTTYHNSALRGPLEKDFGLGPERLVQVPQAVDPEIFHPNGKGDVLHPRAQALWASSKDRPRLVVTAHLNVACDLSPVLQAFGLLLKRLPRARLLVAGGGPDQARFECEARSLGVAGETAFTGPLSPLEVAACLRAADVALVYYSEAPANRHRASLKLREALACGSKVAATRVGEAVEYSRFIRLSSPNAADFAESIEASWKNKPGPRYHGTTWNDSARSLEEALLKC